MSADRLFCTPCEAVVPLRETPSETAEMVTQLLWGEYATVLGREGAWLHLRCLHDGYEAWADAQMFALTATLPPRPGGINLDPCLIHNGLRLPLGAWLPTGGLLAPTPPSLVAVAQRFLGTPYLWGGRSGWGIDCSGLMQIVFAAHGLALPRNASVQAGVGQAVDADKIMAGDLVFFSRPGKSNITHVGLATAPDRVLHASGRVREEPLHHEALWRDDRTATHRWVSARRLLQP